MGIRSDFVAVKRLAESADGAMNSGIVLVKNRRNGKYYIEKRVSKSLIREGLADREVEALYQCSQRNICSIYASDLNPSRYGYGSLFIERCDLGSLATLIDKFRDRRTFMPEGFLWKVLWDMSLAICYMQTGIDAESRARRGDHVHRHEVKRSWNAIFHRDIKPANIFLKTNYDPSCQYPTVILGDFGCSVKEDYMYSRRMSAFTRAFEPPEAPNFTDASDIYSTALSVHCAAQARGSPLKPKSRVQSVPLERTHYSRTLEDLLLRCLEQHKGDRPDVMYLPYLVWRQLQNAKREMMGQGAQVPLPSWAFR